MPNAADPQVAEVPIGAIIAYVGPARNLPDLEEQGWLLCDGREVPNDEAHSALWNTIGTTFGEAGYPNFYLPDLRGMFLRGVAQDAQQDPDVADRTSQNTGGNTGKTTDAVGSRQSHQVVNHQHKWDQNFGTISNSGWDLNIQMAEGSPHNGANQGPPQPTTNVDGGGAETRPSNVYVYYLIKAR